MYWCGGDAGLNQHIFKVEPIHGFCKEFIFHQLSNYIVNFIKMADSRKTTMGHITKDHIVQSRIVLPPIEISDKFHDMAAPMHEGIINFLEESKEFFLLRDWLLPMLMNGQVSIRDGGERKENTVNPLEEELLTEMTASATNEETLVRKKRGRPRKNPFPQQMKLI